MIFSHAKSLDFKFQYPSCSAISLFHGGSSFLFVLVLFLMDVKLTADMTSFKMLKEFTKEILFK